MIEFERVPYWCSGGFIATFFIHGSDLNMMSLADSSCQIDYYYARLGI